MICVQTSALKAGGNNIVICEGKAERKTDSCSSKLLALGMGNGGKAEVYSYVHLSDFLGQPKDRMKLLSIGQG